MKQLLIILSLLFGSTSLWAATHKVTNEPDSVFLFAYATPDDSGKSGLKLAWSMDGEQWFSVADGFGYVKCDYGRWGSDKRMFCPRLMRGADGTWSCIWQLNEEGREFALAQSADLMKWNSQLYFTDAEYRAHMPAGIRPAVEVTISLNGKEFTSWAQRVAWKEVDAVIQFAENKKYKEILYGERTEQDAQRFAGLQPVDAVVKVQPQHAKAISDKLIGIFFEDINYAADGGLYAELVQNRGFEYNPADRQHREPGWNSKHSWSVLGNGTQFTIDSIQPIHANNPHYAVLQVTAPGASLVNTGFDGIVVKRGAKYNFSLFAKVLQGKGGKVKVALISKEGKELAQTMLTLSGTAWKKQQAVLTAVGDATDAILAITPQAEGTYAIDMVSLFPQDTYKGRKNGLRPDLAQTLADLHPRFVRFPGGCVAHGDGIENIYRWKNTVGPLEARKPMRNLWNYHQSMGLGYFEYFQFCEDIGAEALPVLAAGVPCQNSAYDHDHTLCGAGQQGGIPMEQMDEYIQDILDLVEWANGDPKTSKWARMRADAGHPKPFNLKYIGIGNEDLISKVFEERFEMIFNAVRAKYPDITVIGTVGPFYEGTDYEVGWELATRLEVPMVDEHYYCSPGWFIHNQEYYDRYDRNKPKVYLGEYAAHLPGRVNNIETALAEALYLTAVERNGDVVSMTSYAPLLAKEGHTQWSPDLIYFNNTEVKPTVGYYTQLLYGQNSGDTYLPSDITLSNTQDAVKKRIGASVVTDSHSGDCIVKLVNMLPVAVRTQVQLPEFPHGKVQAAKMVLSGDPTDKQQRPVTGTLEVGEEFSYEMPAYSFTVIRIPGTK